MEVLREASEGASQYLYAYLAIHAIARRSSRVWNHVEDNATFWWTVTSALQTSTMLALGRIFDPDPATHNVSRLLRLAQQSRSMFSRSALAARRRGIGPEPPWLADFVRDVYEPTPDDFRALRARVARLRVTYERSYRQLRHKVFAHAIADGQEVEQIFEQTNVEELKRLISSLLAIHEALLGLFLNGRKPVLRRLRYSAKAPRGAEGWRPGTLPPHERIVMQAERVLKQASGRASNVRQSRVTTSRARRT